MTARAGGSVRAVVVADDLTGACDAGVSFAPAYVVIREPWPAGADALVFTTDSRNDPPEVAAAKVRALCARLPDAAVVFKKIDSVLRGNVHAELEAMRGLEGAVVCPAFPEQGRTVRDGVAMPAGVDLRAVLQGLPVRVADAATPADLARIAALGARLYVGSAGLARAVGGVPRRITERGGVPCRPLVVIGSRHEATLAQVEALRASGLPHELRMIDMAAPEPLDAEVIPRAAFLCGGDTAAWALAQWGALGIELAGEIEPGVPFGVIAGGRADGCAVITKSGGFGGADTLVNAVRILGGR